MSCKHEKFETYHGLQGLYPFDYCVSCGVKKSDIQAEPITLEDAGSYYDEIMKQWTDMNLQYVPTGRTRTINKIVYGLSNSRNVAQEIKNKLDEYYMNRGYQASIIYISPKDYIDLSNMSLPFVYANNFFNGIPVEVSPYVMTNRVELA